MNDKIQVEGRRVLRGIATRVSVVLLLILLAGLSTLAKNGLYFSSANAAHHVSMSTKMNVAHAPAVVVVGQLKPFPRTLQLLPIVQRTRVERFTSVPIPQLGVTLSMQHRSPPLRFI
jgi:hypothetical protein